MVKGYQSKCDYGDGCGMEEHESHDMLGADYVLATDYAALAKDRDEWKRRCEAIVAILEPGSAPCDCTTCDCGNISNAKDMAAWGADKWACDTARAIAEGRDNG